MEAEIKQISDELIEVRSVFNGLLKILPSFKITDEKLLPYGLKPHTRSVSWLVEQVITQQTKFNAKGLGLDSVDINMPDTSLNDCIIKLKGLNYFINIKTHNVDGKENKNDIAAVEKLYMQYVANKDYRLIYACFGIRFSNVTIAFDPGYLEIFSPQFLPIYINPRNDKIQASYKHKPEYRTRRAFLTLLKENSKSIIL